MTDVADAVAAQYSGDGLLDAIREGLRAAGADPDRPAPSDLKAVDEFHTGGAAATEALLAPLRIAPRMRVLDIGCGIGGTARFIAERYGARVTGIDQSPGFVATAQALGRMVGLDDFLDFRVADALDLPFADGSVDLVTMLHVGMNIPNKRALFKEVKRVLAPRGRFALYDVMMRGPGTVPMPMPWASDEAANWITPPESYRYAAQAVRMVAIGERDRGAFADDVFRQATARGADGPPPPLGLHLVMGETAAEKYGNLARATLAGTIGPWEMVFGKPRSSPGGRHNTRRRLTWLT